MFQFPLTFQYHLAQSKFVLALIVHMTAHTKVMSTLRREHIIHSVTIAHNTVTENGGGVHLSTSELNCLQIKNMSTVVFFNNTAVQNGGGLHAISSSIKATYTILEYNMECVFYYNTGARINFTKMKQGWEVDCHWKPMQNFTSSRCL